MAEPAPAVSQHTIDRRSDRRVVFVTIVILFAIFRIGTVPLSSYQAAMGRAGNNPAIALVLPDIGLRLCANLILLAIELALVLVFRPSEHSRWRLVLDFVVVGVGSAAAYIPVQVALGFYGFRDWRTALVEAVTVMLSAVTMLGVALVHVSIRRRVREQERSSARQELRAAAALDALATEELRVRREVAEGLHGTVQQNLVVLGVRLDALADRLRAASDDAQTPGALAEIAGIRTDLDVIREHDVRTMSQLLYPVGLELGAVAALRLLLQRLPATIATTVAIGDEVLALEGNGNAALSVERRLLLVRVVEEALSNSLRHGRASGIAVTLAVENDTIVLTFDDDGFGLGAVITPHGIARLGERLDALGGAIALDGESLLGGTRLMAWIPVRATAGGNSRQPSGGSGQVRFPRFR